MTAHTAARGHLSFTATRHPRKFTLQMDRGVTSERARIAPVIPHKVRWFGGARGYLLTVGVVLVVTLVTLALVPLMGTQAVIPIYFLMILVLSLYVSRGATVAAALLAALSWNFLFLPPLYTLHIEHIKDAIMFVMFLGAAVISGAVTARLRFQVEAVRVREERLSFLYNASDRLNQGLGVPEILSTAAADLRRFFGASSIFFLADKNGDLEPTPGSAVDADDLRAARYAFSRPRSANNSGAEGKSYFPIETKDGTIGVIGVRLPAGETLDAERTSLLYAYIDLVAIMLHRDALLELTQRARTNEEIDRLYKTLLNLITHELRTPLSIVRAALSSLADRFLRDAGGGGHRLVTEASQAVDRLNRLIENLLDMSRIESGKLTLNLDWCDLREILTSAVHHLTEEYPGVRVDLNVGDVPLVRLDFNLMEKVFYNLVRNAVLHNAGRADLHISVRTTVDDSQLSVIIEDNGRGLPPVQEELLFTKFSKATESSSGLGIGLSIVKGILDAHQASIHHEKGPGARFIVAFQLNETNMRAFEMPI